MRPTDYTDYTLRVLMFCALQPDRSVTIAELATSHGILKTNSMKKIANDLANKASYRSQCGRGGGLKRKIRPTSALRCGARQ
jgi:Rrf2 family nitric oxide-sensitive transcriptional repressor